MDKLLGFLNLSTLGSIRLRRDDDCIDRLSHRYTTFLLLIFAIIITSKQYVGDPISCWAPGHFTSSYVDYTNKMCWVSNTYYVSFSQKHIPGPEAPRKLINYYQWVPLILLVQTVGKYFIKTNDSTRHGRI